MDNAQGPASPGADASSSDPQPVGLRAQLAAVVAAARRLLASHVELAKAELGEIAAEIGRVALLAGIAFVALLVAAFLVPIGLLLFLGEWIFGSIGWGVLLGGTGLVAVAVLSVLVAIGMPRGDIGRAFLVALVIGAVLIAVGIILHISLRPWAAMAIFVALVAWPATAGWWLSRRGIDMDAFKARFYPGQTIETTKETIEWVRERTPLGRKS